MQVWWRSDQVTKSTSYAEASTHERLEGRRRTLRHRAHGLDTLSKFLISAANHVVSVWLWECVNSNGPGAVWWHGLQPGVIYLGFLWQRFMWSRSRLDALIIVSVWDGDSYRNLLRNTGKHFHPAGMLKNYLLSNTNARCGFVEYCEKQSNQVRGLRRWRGDFLSRI